MFNSTHTLVGLVLARTGLDRWTPHAAATAMLAANLPDIDIIAQLAGTPSYIEHHRGITHTFIGVPLLSLILAAALWKVTKNFGKTFVVACLAMATHPLLDYANPYGLRPFIPWSGTWYYGDTLAIIDPYLDLVLLTTVLASGYFTSRRRSIAFAGFAFVAIHVIAHVQLRDVARHHLAGFADGIPGVRHSAVLPQILDPFIWTGVVETDTEDIGVFINTMTGAVDPVARLPKSGASAISNRAAAAPAARVFLGFARFPVTTVTSLAEGYRVNFADFRFYNGNTRSAFGAEIILDRSLNVVRESMGFNQDVD